MSTADVIVGFKAHLGWLAAVAIAARAASPQPLYATRLDLFSDQPRDVREPYHVAGGWDGLDRVSKPANPAALIERAKTQQTRHTTTRLTAFDHELQALDMRWVGAVMLIGRGIVHTLDEILPSHAHIHIPEGEAVRTATRTALKDIGLACTDQDEKSASGAAADALGISTAALEEQLKQQRPPQTRSWTKEHRTIAAATWLACR